MNDARCCQCEITGCHGNSPGAGWRDELSCSERNGERDLVGIEDSQGLKVCQECGDKYRSGGYSVTQTAGPSAKAEAIVDALDMAQQIVPNSQWST